MFSHKKKVKYSRDFLKKFFSSSKISTSLCPASFQTSLTLPVLVEGRCSTAAEREPPSTEKNHEPVSLVE